MNLPRDSLSDAGPWFRPSQASPLIGRSARYVRALCQDKLIDHREDFGSAGDVRHLISQQAINRHMRNHTTSARGAA